jgi:site-specific recombinase XerD
MLRILQEWSNKALIQKHITFHCARHTFITHIMSNGANIKTAASLAGHSTTKHTEKYIHIIDELKQKAVDSLPDIQIL